jgi:ribosomal protein L23
MATKKDTTKKDTTAAVSPSTLVLKRPRVTEKAANYSKISAYVFDVAFEATKSEVAKAFQTQYKHKPVKVNIMPMQRKSFFRKGQLGFGKRAKKAYVYLAKGTTIDIA